MCSLRKYPYLPHRRDFCFTQIPLEIPIKLHTFLLSLVPGGSKTRDPVNQVDISSNFLVFQRPAPPENSSPFCAVSLNIFWKCPVLSCVVPSHQLRILIVKPGSHMPPTYLGHGCRQGLGQRCGICEHLSPTHNLSQALIAGLPAKLNSALLRRQAVVNACHRLCVSDECSHMPQLSQAVPAAMSQVDWQHMRTRLNSGLLHILPRT